VTVLAADPDAEREPAGRKLCSAYVAGEPERFRRLLTEQVRVGDLREAAATPHAST